MNRFHLSLSFCCALLTAGCEKKPTALPAPATPIAAAPNAATPNAATPNPGVPTAATPTAVAAPAVAGTEVTIPSGAPGEPPAIPLGTKMHCPVSSEDFTVKPNTMQVIYKGKRVAFCCPDCYPDFKKDPGKYQL